MKVLIGACGLGNGHALRQIAIAGELMAQGHDVCFFAHDRSKILLGAAFPDADIIETRLPWLPSDNNGLLFDQAVSAPENARDLFLANLRAMEAAVSRFGCAPDLVVTDYEPTAAQFAYTCDVPLITIDNQSFALGSQCGMHGGRGPREERARLRMFFPAAARRLVTTCFSLPQDGAFEPIPPIIRSDVTRLAPTPVPERDRLIVVYISAYRTLADDLAAKVEAMRRHRDWRFAVFSSEAVEPTMLADNVRIHPFSTHGFLAALGECRAVAMHSGHSLMSELVHLEIPMYLMPLDTYEQHYNAAALAGLGLGRIGDERLHGFGDFLDASDDMAAAFATHKRSGAVADRSDGAAVAARILTSVATH